MTLEQFLDKVVAQGNYLVFAYKLKRGMQHQHFARDELTLAADWARGMSVKGAEVWHAVASYRDIGNRKAENVDHIKALWFDADIMRPGDGKTLDKAFADEQELIRWVAFFHRDSGFPLPNLWVKSGYGVHLYWTLENDLTKEQWQPYANAFKELLLAHKAKGDLGVVADAARILRPIETYNHKVPAFPAPCFVFNGWDKPDHPNTILNLLVAAPAKPISQPLGLPPVAKGKHNLAAMFKQTEPDNRRPHHFNLIVDRCEQVRLSAETGGIDDSYPIWYPLVTLANWCNDRQAAHTIGDQHPKYTHAGTEAAYDQVSMERQKKDFGAPLCETFNAERPGICDTCPFRKEVKTPYSLGVDDNPTDPDEMPFGFRRNNGWLEHSKKGKKKDDPVTWHRIIQGDVRNPVLDRVNGHLRILFDLTVAGDTTAVAVEETEIISNPSSVKVALADKGVTLNLDNPIPFGRFLMAWIEKLRAGYQVRATPLPSFGWAREGGKVIGFSTGAVCYKSDGTEERAPGADPKLLEHYQTKGDIALWREAASIIIKDEPTLQIATAVAFGAPLMSMTDESGVCISLWGNKSGTGKTSAFRAGATVWGNPKHTVMSLDDTFNYVPLVMGTIKALPAYWDEGVVNDDNLANVKNTIFKVTLGRDKGRATSDIKIRHSGEWQTIMAIASNTSIRAIISDESVTTDAGPLRVLDIEHTRPPMPLVAELAPVFAQLNHNYGLAGIEYAKYLATNVEAINDMMVRVRESIRARTMATNDERFYVSGSAAVIVGAALATKMGLLEFDVPAMADVLCASIINTRIERREEIPVENPRQFVMQVINNFCSDFIDEAVITKYFKGQGRRVQGENLEAVPVNPYHKRSTPAYQIGLREQVLRFDKRCFHEWCRTHGHTHNHSKLYKLMVSELNGKNGGNAYAPIGAGTDFSTPRAHYMEVPMLGDLSHWITQYTSTNVVPLKKRI